ncbi:hypothetical protein ACFLYU_05755 [Candidatus Dependentiae bacterium]
MKLKIISPETEQDFEVAWVDVQTHVGNFVILKDHAPMVATLVAQEPITFCLQNGKQETITPEGGTVEVFRKEIVLLLRSTPK